MQTRIKSLIIGLGVLALPVAAIAGGGQAWKDQQQTALPTTTAEAGAQPDAIQPRVLSSIELGMHFAHGPGKNNPSTRIAIPGTVYTVEGPSESSHAFNKRAMIMELKEDQVKGQAM